MAWTKVDKGTGSWNPDRLLRYLLQETGDYLLQEDGNRIGLEWFWTKISKHTGIFSKVSKSIGSFVKTAKSTGTWTKVPKGT